MGRFLTRIPAVMEIKTVADILIVTPETVSELIVSGELSYLRVGRSIRITKASLVDYIDRNTKRYSRIYE